MINGRTFADAANLISSATTAEAAPMTAGKFLFMNGGDQARSAMDFQYDTVIDELSQRGILETERVAYDPNRTGERLASFLPEHYRWNRRLRVMILYPVASSIISQVMELSRKTFLKPEKFKCPWQDG